MSNTIQSGYCPICQHNVKFLLKLPCGNVVCFDCAQTPRANPYRCPTCGIKFASCLIGLMIQQLWIPEISLAYEYNISAGPDTVFWLYGGNYDGWWIYETKHQAVIEKAYEAYKQNAANRITINMTVSDQTKEYIINFNTMEQYSVSTGNIRPIRRIIYDKPEVLSKEKILGIACKRF
jgi:WWE domain